MTTPKPVYLIGGSAYIYRAYHAIAPLSNKDGLPTHAVFGFTNILLRLFKEKNPQRLAVAFDVKGGNFRHDLYPEYKANRPPMPDDLAVQIPYIKQVVAAYNIPCLEQQGVEADDILAAAAHRLTAEGIPVVIVSGDKDLLQLVSDSISFWDPMNNRFFDPAAVHKKYNVTPQQLLDFFALIGDSADNVPGVPGVGPKTAEKLINQFGNLEGLYENIESLPKNKLKEKLADNRELAFLSRKLIRLKTDLEVPANADAYLLPEPDSEKLRELFTELNFTRLIKNEVPAQTLDYGGFQAVRNQEQLAACIKAISDAPRLVIDTETNSLDTLTTDLVGISLCINPKEAYYLPLGHRNDEGELRNEQLDKDTALAALRPLLEDENTAKIGHNLKFDYHVLLSHGVTLRGPFYDSMIASYLLDPSRRTHKLDDLCEMILSRRLTSFAEVTNGDKRPDSFVYVDPQAAADYSCEDVHGALLLWDNFAPQLKEQNLWELYTDLEMKLVPILAGMERKGILIDPRILAEMSKEFEEKIADLETDIYRMAGREFNVNSPRQLGEILFDELGLPHGRKTKTGYSTDAKVLEKLAAQHELPATVIYHRTISKLKSTYVDKLATLIHPQTGRIHTSFNQTVTATGRLSSSNPNLQNIPIRTDEGQRIRQAFIAAPGHKFLAADYSQIDLRVLAHYSQDPALLEAFRNNEDVHLRTAAEIFRINSAFVTPPMRRVAKTINFGIVYGMSAFGLASQLNIGRKEAATFIERYFELYGGVKKFMEEIVAIAHQEGFVTTLLHRRRPLPEISSSNKTQREFAERTAINTPIQGTAADIIKLAMINTEHALTESNLSARILLQIHDELVLEVPEDELAETEVLVKKAMESVMDLDVPLLVNITIGDNLGKT
ncbi:MAG: DNA polymerase I [Desulfobulbaceae bacterium]|nr:DNA polymerase I [Desulfobulbaceae bacterium]